MKRVAIWNDGPVAEELGGGTRGNDNFKPTFDLALLSEEVKEFYKALANNDIVEMVDAQCDMKFVWEGIEFKYGCTSYSYEASNLNNFYENEKAFRALVEYFEYHNAIAINLINREFLTLTKATQKFEIEQLTFDTLNEAYDIVCFANEQKTTTKNNVGKTMKGPLWENPGAKIYQLLIDKGIINEVH